MCRKKPAPAVPTFLGPGPGKGGTPPKVVHGNLKVPKAPPPHVQRPNRRWGR